MTEETSVNGATVPRELLDQAEQAQHITQAKECEYIEGYDESEGVERDTIHIQLDEWYDHGYLVAYMREHGWYVDTAVPGSNREVCYVFRDRRPEAPREVPETAAELVETYDEPEEAAVDAD